MKICAFAQILLAICDQLNWQLPHSKPSSLACGLAQRRDFRYLEAVVLVTFPCGPSDDWRNSSDAAGLTQIVAFLFLRCVSNVTFCPNSD